MRNKFPIGTRVRVCFGSGCDSDKTATVIDRREVPMRKDGTGIPDLSGYYSQVDWNKEVALRYDEGYIRTMYKNRLILI